MTRLGSVLLSVCAALAVGGSAEAQAPSAAATPGGIELGSSASLAGVDSAPDPTQAPADRIQLYVDGLFGFAGELRGGDPDSSLQESELVPSVGFAGGAVVPIGRWFALGASGGGRVWKTQLWQEDSVDRDWLFDATVRPRLRFVPEDARSEVYVTAPLGVLLPVLADDKSTAKSKADGDLGWTAGAALGGNYFVYGDVGLHYELAYQYQRFGYGFEARGGAPTKEVTESLHFQQVVLSLGLVVAL